jgi:CDP-diacylglycerol--glycerol-3-phosphate 3-phosphatidyltransferase
MGIELRKQSVPWLMAAGRAALGPILIAGTACSWNGVALAAMVVTALVSDIFDGVLARRWGCDTAGVRLFDSMADTVFYVCVAVALWIGQPGVWRHYAGLLIPLLSLEILRFGLDFAKFGKPASYHSYLAKCWGLTMALGVIAVFWLRHASPLLSIALSLGIACNLEGLAMSLVLPVWRKDVKTLRVAWQLRGQMTETAPPALDSESRKLRSKQGNFTRKAVVTVGVLALVLGLPLSASAFAVETGQVAYTGGSVGIARDTVGALDTTSPTTLVFKFRAADGRPGRIDIAYKGIHYFSYHDEVAHQMGVLPLIVISLVKPRERKHIFTIGYEDSNGSTQVATFEVGKRDQREFMEILRARDPQICSKPALACGGSYGFR